MGFAVAVLILPATEVTAADVPAMAAETTKVAALSPATIGRTLQVRKGDTLMKLLIDAGIARPEAHAAIAALSQVYSPRDLKPGQSIELLLSAPGDNDGPRLASLSLQPDLTGSSSEFVPARALYLRNGFELRGPFAEYVDDLNSVFMTKQL